jgi:hypothetical protein
VIPPTLLRQQRIDIRVTPLERKRMLCLDSADFLQMFMRKFAARL